MNSQIFNGSLDALGNMIAFVKQHASKIGFDGLDLGRIELVAEEALVNIISYGYPDGQGNIEISCSQPKDNALKIEIKDHGIPFNPLERTKKPDVNAPLEERTCGGYGIYFILKIMDEVDYKRKDDANVLTMVKYRGTNAEV